MAPSDIVTLTGLCKLSITDLFRDRHLDTDSSQWLEVQSARLDLWAQSLGVFANDELSITHRLSKNQQVTKIIVQLLTALKGNLYLLRCAVDGQKPDKPERGPNDSEDSDDTDDSDDSNGSDYTAIIAQQEKRIQDGLGRLGQVAVRLRRDGTKRSAERAVEYEPVGEAGELLAPSFEDFIKAKIRREFDPLHVSLQSNFRPVAAPDVVCEETTSEEHFLLPSYLRDRLRLTMLSRWRRIAYQRHHAVGLAGPQETKPALVDAQMGQGRALIAANIDKQVKSIAKQPLEASKHAQKSNVGRAPKTAATETPQGLVIDKKTDLIPKAAGTMTTKVRAGDLSFPPPPIVKPGADLFICPFCGLPQSTSILPRRKWQIHIMQDLAPYICVFEQCKTPLQTYSTSDEWHQHLKQEHTHRTWVCNACQHSTHAQFDDGNDYSNHLQTVHADDGMTPQKVALLVDFGAQHQPPKFPHCLFCGFISEAYEDEPDSDDFQKEVLEHMQKRHMQAFALDSMPWDIPGDEDDDDYRLSLDSHTESADEREKIMLDDDLELHFELDDNETRGIEQDPSLEKYLKANASAAGAMFLEIRKRFTSTDQKESLAKLRELIEKWLANEDTDEDGAPVEAQLRRKSTSFSQNTLDESFDDKDTFEPVTESLAKELDEAVALIRIVRTGNVTQLHSFLKTLSMRREMMSSADNEGLHALQYAALAVEPGAMIKLLADAGFSQDAPIHTSTSTLSPLALAAVINSVPAAQALVDAGFGRQPWSDRIHTLPLHAACAAGSLEVVKYLLSRTELFSDLDEIAHYDMGKGLAVLRSDIDENQATLESLVLAKQAETFMRQSVLHKVECSPLAIAALHDRHDVMELLLHRGADVLKGILATWRRGDEGVVRETLLTLTASEGSISTVKLLLDAGAEPLLTNSSGGDAAAVAAITGRLDIVKLLCEHTKNDDRWRRSMVDALISSTESKDVSCTGYLLDQGIDVNAKGTNNCPALLTAIQSRSIDIFELLICRGANIEDGDSNGHAALSTSCGLGFPEFTERLLELGAKTDVQSWDGSTPMIWTCKSLEQGTTACLKLLLDAGADLELADNDGNLPLYLACDNGFVESGKALIAAGAKLDAKGGNNWTALMAAAYRGRIELVQALLDAGADINIMTTGICHWTALLAAVSPDGHAEVVKLLVEAGADIEVTDHEACTPLFLACKYGQVDILKYLIAAGAKLDVEDDSGDTTLMTIVKENHVECLQVLLDTGIAQPDQEAFWKPALMHAAFIGSLACLRLFLTKTVPDIRDSDGGATPLMRAAAGGHLESVQLLLDAGADVSLADDRGLTTLQYATGANNDSIVEILLKRGADVEAVDGYKNTALVWTVSSASTGNSTACVKLLLEAGANPNDVSNDGRSVLNIAVRECPFESTDLIKALVEHPSIDINARGSKGWNNPLFEAIRIGRTDIMELMLANNADTSYVMDDHGFNCLGYAMAYQHFSATRQLLKKDVKLIPGSNSDQIRTMLDTLRTMLEDESSNEEFDKLRKARSVAQRRLCELRANGDVLALIPTHLRTLLRYAVFRARDAIDTGPRVTFADDQDASTTAAVSAVHDSSSDTVEEEEVADEPIVAASENA